MKNTYTAYIYGMTCLSCAATVEKTLQSQQSIKTVRINFADHTAFIEFKNDPPPHKEVAAAVKKAGYQLHWSLEGKDNQADIMHYKEYSTLKKNTLWAIIFSTPVLIIAMFLPETPLFRWLVMLLSLPILFIWGRGFFKRAWKTILYRNWGMDVLVSLSTSIAFFYSAFNTIFPQLVKRYSLDPHVYFETAVVIICFLLIGKTLEHRARMKASEAIRQLMDLQPDSVNLLLENGEELEVSVNEVHPGSHLRIKPGEKIPVDGRVQKSHSYIDERMISGESLPVFKTIGDKVFAGTVNQGGSFDFTAEKTGANTFLASIIRAVRQAQSSRAPIERIADKIARAFVPLVVVIAFTSFFVWGFSDSESGWLMGMRALLSVLIISCPCALGLAVPTALIAGIGRAAQEGILIKDAESLEYARKTDHLILDKTGTLTQGKPIIKEIFWKEENEHKISILLALEGKSEHPLAAALLLHYKNRLVKTSLSLENFKNHPGKGVQATYQGENYRIGSISWLEEQAVIFNTEFQARLSDWKKQSYTLLGFSEGNRLLALFALADILRPEAKEAVEKLQAMGIHLYMLTGDRTETAKILNDQLRFFDFKGAQLPSDKMNFIKDLQSKGQIVAMIGDGINDAPALAQADLSIAMGHGAGVALDVAKITILGSDLRKIPFAIRLSEYSWRTIRQNLFWAFIYNSVSIPLAAGILYPFNGFLLNPVIASAAMALSSISVIINSLRLRNL
ncbi:heavy metal translocating P-type ATPase [Bacteroidetes bacterium endosymbiont of Geopemphigus sp.]|uniref:heavy metal translocating P-type ATPase n=1 Tax=Bacteroidetes bacterium endosymbiont of Geopemphigus sp. TaxID=2047937 RepID=UPI000CCFFCDC|nr:heavy metal translocating P-type ATPase [Bacteroidetes bacterium endosymbiont of Geopemphigus sp.]